MKRPVKPSSLSAVFGESRGRLLVELCGRPQTATELAVRVATSANAVRVHLDSLAAGGLVEFVVERRGVGKPTHVYSLTRDAEYFLSKAYAPALGALIATLRLKMNGQFLPTLRDAGAALGRTSTASGVDGARKLLQSLGASTTIKKRSSSTELRTACCPLGLMTRESAAMCSMIEGALSTASGMPVTEHCDRGDHPKCMFVIATG
jgi:predicted ArsR family transcriptional regulator